MKKLILFLMLTAPAFGQAPAIPGLAPRGAENPGVPNNPPPVVVLNEKPDPMAMAVPKGQPFEHPNLDGRSAAMLYYKHTGIRVLVSQAAAGAEISIVQPGPLTNREAANLLEKRLLMEGIAMIPSATNPLSGEVVEVKMVMQQAPMWEGPQVYGNIEELPEGDEFINYVMALEYLKPEEAQRAFTSLVGQFGPSGKVAAIPNASSLIISANTPLVRMLIELKNRIDVPSARVGTKFIDVEYADVEELAERLNEIFNNQRQGNQSARVQRTANTPQIPGLQANTGAPGSGGAGEDITLNIIPDTRTNRIFVMGRPVDLVFVEGLIEDFDSPSSKRNFLRRKLKYLPVAEFLSVAENALERTGTVTGGGSTGGSSRSSASRSTSSSNRTSSTSSSNRSSGSNQSGFGGSGGSSGSRASLNQQDINTAPESILVGKTLLVADNISNSIVVQGPPHHVEVIEKLLDELDVPSEQIAITAVFGRYDIGKDRNFGIDLASILQGVGGSNFSLAGNLRTGVPSVVDPGTLDSIANAIGAAGAAGNGLSLYGMLGDEFGIFVNALESNSNFTAISRPTVFTTNNHEARISSGSRIAVPTSTFQGGSSTGFSTNVEFRDIVLELVVLPLVNDQDEVTLQISLVRDNTGENRFIEGFGNVPDIDTDEISTTVTVPNRSTIILGGLITESDKDGQSGIPILSSIPGIGRLFGRTTAEVKREELVIMIHPSIIYTDAQMEGYQQAYDIVSEVSPKARASVENSGLLPNKGSLIPSSGKSYPRQTASRPAVQPLIQPATSPTQRAMQSKLRNKRRR